MAEMSHCYGCGAYIPELLIDENNKVNFRCTRCGCETRPQNTLDEAERLWNEGRTYPHDEKQFWNTIERKTDNG